MKASKTGLRLYRGLYWANQGLLYAVRALQEARQESEGEGEAEPDADQDPAAPRLPAAALLNDRLRRTQAMIEETRALMNRTLAEWIERKE